MPENYPTALDTEETILFLGSGFSRYAKNVRGTAPPMVYGLEVLLGRILGVDSKKFDLRTLADMVGEKKDVNLHKALYELYTVTTLDSSQDEILQRPWRRIYTTNFDDTVEVAYHKHNINSNSYIHTDTRPKTLDYGSIIHLHGSIGHAEEDSVLSDLILGKQAYETQGFNESSWYVDLCRDLECCYACVFIGYSLKDYHIAELLKQNSAFRNKTFFITEKKMDREEVERIEQYGVVRKIGVSGFANECNTLPRPAQNSDPHLLKSFRYLDPETGNKASDSPTPIEIQRIVTHGKFHFHRYISTLNSQEYVVSRKERLDKAVSMLADVRCLLVHSSIGNGKSIFLKMLAHKLSMNEYRSFLFRTDSAISSHDLDTLKSFDKVAIFYDSYHDAIENISKFEGFSQDIKHIVAVRTGIHDVRQHEIIRQLPNPRKSLDINGLIPAETKEIKSWLKRSGILIANYEELIDKSRDFRDIVLNLYKNKQIKEAISQEVEPLMNDRSFRKVLTATHLLKSAGHDVSSGFLHTVSHCDAYKVLANYREISTDMFNIDNGRIVVRSAMFSEYLVQNHLEESDIIDCVFNIVTQAVSLREQPRYNAIMGKFMQVSFLNKAINNTSGNFDRLVNLFEQLRAVDGVRKEPLFWLQYAILMNRINDTVTAEHFIQSAYESAAKLDGFETFQIDTFSLRLFLRIETESVEDSKVSRFDKIISKLDRVRETIGDESKRYHAIDVLQSVEPFVQARISVLSGNEMMALEESLKLIDAALSKMTIDERVYTGSDLVRTTLGQIITRLSSYSGQDSLTD